MSTTRRDFLKQTAASLAAVGAAGAADTLGAPTPSARRGTQPNIVIIFCDDLGYGDIGTYGAQGYSTPNLDKLAREGRQFSRFYAAQAVCSASRAGLLTGCYPNRIGIHGALGPNARHGISDDEMTLGQLVRQEGYATACYGKWHLGDNPRFLPTRHGFDEYFGLPYSNDMWPMHPEAKPGAYPPLPLIEGEKTIKAGLSHDDQNQLTTWYTEHAVDFIRRHRQQPFLLYLAHSMPHVPLHVSDKFRGKTARGLFGDVISEIDWSVGQVVDTLERYGLTDNTLVIFTSDNGPWLSYGDHAGSAGPLREGKGTSWDGGFREPCLMRWPGQIPAGTRCDTMAMTIDLLPAIAGLTGAKLPDHPIDGRDIWPIIAGQPGAASPHDAYFIYYETNQLQAVITDRWKLQLPHTYRTLAGRPGGHGGIPALYSQAKVTQPELYDQYADIGERIDVADRHPEAVRELLALADRCRDELGDALTGRTGRGSRQPGRLP